MTTADLPIRSGARPTDARALAIDLSHVEKTYKGRVRALRGVSMRVHRGEVFGLLGPNGAGKSTLVKILLTIVRPSRCEGGMLGAPVGHKGTLARVGYLPEHLRFPDYLTGAQALDYFAALARVPRADRRKRAAELLDLVGMTAWSRKQIKGYSKGMKQRLGVAQALMNDPDLVFLDEPTDGVDPVGRRDIRNVLMHARDRGKTVFINSHLLSELEMVCERVAIMVQGVVAQQGTIEELTEGQRRYEIELALPEGHTAAEALHKALPGRVAALEASAPPPADPALARRVSWRGALATGESVLIERSTIHFGSDDPERVQPIVDALRARGFVIRALRPYRPSLEDLFMQAVTDPATGEELKPGASDAPALRAKGRK